MSQFTPEQLLKHRLVEKGEERTAPFEPTALFQTTHLMDDLLKQTPNISYCNLRKCLGLWEGGEAIGGIKPHELFLRYPIFIGSFGPFINDSLKELFTRAISEIMNPNVSFNPRRAINRLALEKGFGSAVAMRRHFDEARESGRDELTFGLIIPDNIHFGAGEHAIIEVPIVSEVLRAGIWIPPEIDVLTENPKNRTDTADMLSGWNFSANIRPLCSQKVYTVISGTEVVK